jgi:hypothetical protein
MVQGPCAHLGLHERPYVDCRSWQTKCYYMKIHAKVCFPRGPYGANIWSPIGSKFGINVPSQHEDVVLTSQTGHSSLVSFWRCKHVANTLQHVANTLQTRHKHIANTLETRPMNVMKWRVHNDFPGCKITTSQRHFFTSLQRDAWRVFHVFSTSSC